MKIVSMNEGPKIDYSVEGTKLDFDDGALMVDLSRWQKDYEVTKDIMVDHEGDIAIGTGAFYIAQIVIPATVYTDGEAEAEEDDEPARTAEPLNMDDVTLKLFSVASIKIN